MTQRSTPKLARQLVKFYRRSILRDPFLRAVKQWKKDDGDQRLRLDYELTADSTVLDVGGYVGDFADAIWQKFGCRVLIFEPMPEFFQQCEQRFAGNDKISVFNYGLGDNDEELQLSNSADGSSFCQSDGESVPAQIRDVAAVWRELNLQSVDLMKLNIEGGEYPLLDRMLETGLADQVENLQIQFHNFVHAAESQRNSLRNRLAQTHEEQWCYDFVWENWKSRNKAA